MKRTLTRLGCNVSTAENGQLALDMIVGSADMTQSTDGSRNISPILEQHDEGAEDPQRYAVVFLDNQMPVLSGLKAVAELRDLGRHDFVVGVTGTTSYFLDVGDGLTRGRQCAAVRSGGIHHRRRRQGANKTC